MPRNRQKNAYFTVGIPLESELYLALKADAQETGISIPQLLAVRLSDWYRFSATTSLSAGLQAAKLSGATQTIQQQVSTPLSDLQARASAAVAAWGGGDDE